MHEGRGTGKKGMGLRLGPCINLHIFFDISFRSLDCLPAIYDFRDSRLQGIPVVERYVRSLVTLQGYFFYEILPIIRLLQHCCHLT